MSIIAGISEPFEQPTFCFGKGEWTSSIEYFDHLTFKVEYFDHLTFKLFVFACANEYLPSADKRLLHIYCNLFASTSL